MICNLSDKKCIPCEGGISALTCEQAKAHLEQLQDWQINESCTEIFKSMMFKNY